uniref:TOD1/MUCI70 glycosyltransferase-like domain-containing protein n=1 Tax=Oryza glumipatula TaxID=40148 RepID=A0A0E0AEJ1_9ORYZ
MGRRSKGGGAEGDGMRMQVVWRKGAVRLVLVSAIAWALLVILALAFHLWSCNSDVPFLSALCKKDSKVLYALDSIRSSSKPLHRCPIPVADDPDSVTIPKRTPNTIVKRLSYITVVKQDKDPSPLFGGRQSWKQREDSFKLNATMKVHCGFMKNSGADMDDVDVKYIQKCKIVVASGIFDGYDIPHQPSNISIRSQKLFCFLMVVDEVSLDFIEKNTTVKYLWRGKYTFAVAVHKHHRSIYEEGDAIKRRKRYARPLVDLQMKMYYHEGMEPWNPKKRMPSDVPEGAVLIREHTTMSDLFSCLWFNEVNLFTPRDQLSFGYVVYRLGDALKFFMFPNCEYNSLFILHRHTREHSSKVEWAKTIDEIVKKGLKESKGGLGLWTPYPADLSSVELPSVKRTSPAG